ncbi:PQQ-binding-like beta-propeller repeat protein [Streptomyces sp. NPDC004732]|uniref:outer membrane protein assembly factor BamB family protein n=1 Tax=Streptomyces sp. NPDC004732 TaxID=3154290 RepID=UPI0033BF6E06
MRRPARKPTRKHARYAWYTGGGILLTLSLLALLIGDGSTSPKPLERPNALEVAWTFRSEGRALDVADLAAPLNDRLLAVPQGNKVSLVDTRDGRPLSQLHSSADEFTPIGFSGGGLLTTEWGTKTGSLSMFDPETGRKLWRRTTSPIKGQARDYTWLRNAAALPDSGPVLQAADNWLAGLAPRTGAARWRERMPTYTACDNTRPGEVPSAPLVGATANRVVLLRHCPGQVAELQVLNAENGHLVWKKKLGRMRQIARLVVDRHAIGVTLDDRVRVFTESGAQLLRQQSDPAYFLALGGETDGTLYVTAGNVLRAVRTDTGRTRWKLRQKASENTSHVTSEAVVGEVFTAGAYVGDLRWSVGDARLQGPGASRLTDLEGKRTATVPWPVAGAPAGVSGDLFIVRSDEREGTRYTALRPVHRDMDAATPAALAGVDRSDWPDACRMVDASLLARLGKDYIKLPVKKSRTILGTKLPHPSVCRFAAESASGSDGDIFTVTVRWVAPDAKAARTYVSNALPWGCDPPLETRCVTAGITTPRPGVHLYTYRTGLEQSPVAHATVVSGRYVVGVSAGDNESGTKRLVREVATSLTSAGHRHP